MYIRTSFLVIFLILNSTSLYAQSYSLLSNNNAWRDTGGGNSLEKDDSIYFFKGKGIKKSIRTDSEVTNVHSHYQKNKASRFRNYIYTGRMMIEDADGGIGVTFYSRYGKDDHYYRLRRYSGDGEFHIAPHGTEISDGTVYTGVNPEAGSWYNFKVKVSTKAKKTRIQAKVWLSSEDEPSNWQADCSDSNDTRRKFGKPGIWSMGGGQKRWDRLTVVLQ